MKHLIFFLFMLGSFCKSQTKEILLVDRKNQPIDSVQIYINSKRIGYSNSDGKFRIPNSLPKDSIFFFKSDFANYYKSFDELEALVVLDSLRTIEIEEVTITPIDPKKLIIKILDETKKSSIYNSPSNVAIFNELSTRNQKLYTINNKFFFKPKVGYFIENKTGIFKDFQSTKVDNVFTSVYQLKNEKFALPLLHHRYVTARYIPQLNNLVRNLEAYNFSVKKMKSLCIIDFVPNKTEKELYIGRIIVDENDYGILEATFNLVKNSSNRITTSAKTNSKNQFQIEKEKFVIRYEKINGKYNLVYTTYDLIFKATNGKIKDEVFTMQYHMKTIDNLNIEISIGFDFQTLEYN